MHVSYSTKQTSSSTGWLRPRVPICWHACKRLLLKPAHSVARLLHIWAGLGSLRESELQARRPRLKLSRNQCPIRFTPQMILANELN